MSTPVGALDRTTSRTAARIGKRLIISLAAAAGLAGLGVYAIDWWNHGRFIQSTDDAFVGGDVAYLAPRVPGLIVQVLVTDNQAVHAGDLLIRLDDRDYRASLARADAAVAGQEAALLNLDARYRLQGSMVDEAHADIASAEAELERARFDQDRYRQLTMTHAASYQTFQHADSDAKKAASASQKARAVLAGATLQLAVIMTERRQAEAALAQALADRDLARLNLGYTELRAPVDGIIGNRTAREGAFAAAGSQMLALVPAKGLWVDANFKESQLARMRAGASARITADAVPGQSFTGHVASLAPATGAQFSVIPPENATGNFTKIVQRVPVRIILDGDGGTLGLLRPGLSVTAEVDGRTP